jgi:hypothetical protein
VTEVTDLSADVPSDTYDLAMLKPGTATPNGWVITLAGPSHPKTIAFKNDAQRDRLHKEATIEASQVNGRKFKPDIRTPEDENTRTVKWLVSRIVTWTPVKIGADTIEFSDDAATKLLLKPVMAPYIEQVVSYLQGERSFMPTSATS